MRQIFLAALLSLAHAWSYAGSCLLPTKVIQYDQRFAPEKRKLIEDDFSWLATRIFSVSTAQLLSEALGQPIIDVQHLMNWFKARARILTPTLSEYEYDVEAIDSVIQFPNPLERVVFVKPWGRTDQFPRTGPNRLRNYASNLSSSWYSESKNDSLIWKVKFNGIKPFRINSPRVGVISILDDFFDPNLFGYSLKENSIALRIFRISVLFHEARHSDGHGSQLGLPHTLCPKGHRLEGLPACEKTINGSYGVGLAVLKALKATVSSLQPQESAFLDAHISDYASRLDISNSNSPPRVMSEPEIVQDICP